MYMILRGIWSGLKSYTPGPSVEESLGTLLLSGSLLCIYIYIYAYIVTDLYNNI